MLKFIYYTILNTDNVFPEPVDAIPTKLLPDKAIGHPCA